jgi:alkylation response protein AidB-like acyl-CoA dehydrogenase
LEFTLTREQVGLRDEIRTWLAENVPKDEPPHESSVELRDFDVAWQRRQFEGGWAGVSWPAEYGGRGLGLVEQLIWYEEYARAGAPSIRTCFVGVNHAGPTLIMRGSADQKKRHLQSILTGDEVWCQGFSEPDAGSDLASLRTSARIEGDDFVVNGQKIWTSFAHVADFQELLVRTDPAAPKHRGISWVICDMRSPGIEVRPIRSIDGATDFCEVFYNEVRIPTAHLVGELNQGWKVAMTTLSFERGTAFAADQMAMSIQVEHLVELARTRSIDLSGRPAIQDEEFARRLGALRAEVAALRAMTYMGASRNRATIQPGPEGSFLRLGVGELMQRIAQLAVDLLGDEQLEWSPPVRHRGYWTNDYLFSFSRTISAGSKDIQRNIIGERLLGLPKK